MAAHVWAPGDVAVVGPEPTLTATDGDPISCSLVDAGDVVTLLARYPDGDWIVSHGDDRGGFVHERHLIPLEGPMPEQLRAHPDDTAPEHAELSNAIFDRMIAAEDPAEMEQLARAFTVALPINDPPAPVAAAPAEPPRGSAPVAGVGQLEAERPYTPTDDDYITLVDQDGDPFLVARYMESACANHGSHGWLFLTDNDGDEVVVPVAAVPALTQWLAGRYNAHQARRMGRGEAA